ncbi:MAG: rane protein, partial [Pseudomonas sp.]|nr:rane protein [Pseudomonas sp.]
MDNNKESGTNFAFWIPGSAIIFSLVVSTFALTRAPFLEPRPVGAQFQVETPIEARLWQDPFDALERYRKKVKDAGGSPTDVCTSEISAASEKADSGAGSGLAAQASITDTAAQLTSDTPSAPQTKTKPVESTNIMVALVEGSPYADEVELRRRIRYAILAGFKNSHMVPEDEQHLRCLKLAKTSENDPQINAELPYETFVANPFDPPKDISGHDLPHAKTILFWVKQEYLGSIPLQRLEQLRGTLLDKVPGVQNPLDDDAKVLKIIGPATSAVLRDMYREESEGKAPADIQIYSPLATADYDTLKPDRATSSSDDKTAKEKTATEPSTPKPEMKLLRTVSDDGTMARLLLDEMKLRHVDPAKGLQCTKGAPLRAEIPCSKGGWQSSNRIALISEWDSFYSRALIESFKSQVINDARIRNDDTQMKAVVNNWVLRFSYLRGLDGQLPEDAANNEKSADSDKSKDNKAPKLDLSPLENADGNSQLDYL